MLLRFAVFAMMALGLAGFGGVAFIAFQDRPAPATEPAQAAQTAPAVTRTVLVASGPLRAGVLLKPENLATKALTEAAPEMLDDTTAERTGLSGAMLRRSLAADEPVLFGDVMRPGDRGFLAAVLAPGYRAASVTVDATTGSAGLIWPGDHVDLILTQNLDDPSLPTGHRVAAETALSDVLVIAIDQLLARGVAPTTDNAVAARTVTLQVTPADAERIAVATKLGRLSLAVRAAEDPAKALPTSNQKTTWGADVSPALNTPPSQKAGGATLRLYQGSAEAKEIKF